MTAEELFRAVRAAAWGWPMLALLTGCGGYLTVRLGFFQFTHFGYALRHALGRAGRRGAGRSGGVSPFQAVTTALAATVGTGNIVGVAGAIALGGPGAVFWMEAAALLGMMTKFSEIALAVRFRERGPSGGWVGGPMYYMKNGLGPRFRPLAVSFSVMGALAAFGIGCLTQVNAIASAVTDAARTLCPAVSGREGALSLLLGAALAAACGATYLGGVQRLGRVTARLVPAMAALYLASCLAVIWTCRAAVLPALGRIVSGAFDPSAVTGGAAGVTLGAAVKSGVSRGVFSNEAGLGSAPIAHAAADAEGPAQQGLFGIFEVFADTLVLCTVTALAILTSGVPIPYGRAAGAELTAAAFARVFGPWASVLLAAELSLFAGSTLLTWGLYGARCAEFLLGRRAVRPYLLLFCLLTAVGPALELSLVWSAAETLNALMALPNLAALLALSPETARLLRAQRSSARA